MNNIIKVILDIKNIFRVVSFFIALKWIFNLFYCFNDILKKRNLEPADIKMGNGPFKVRRGKAIANLSGHQIFSGIREIWIRDCYLYRNILEFNDNGLVVDLGANIGVFTQLALASNDTNRVIALEPNKMLINDLVVSVQRNNWQERLKTFNNFIGKETEIQKSASLTENYHQAKYIDELEFIESNKIDTIDFLKIDIEGSEFSLLNKRDGLLARANQLAIEIHSNGGNVELFKNHLKEIDYFIHHQEYHRGGVVVLARKIYL